jgi:hypothetical protein
MRVAPGLVRGVANVTRTLRANPATRPLVRAVPAIVRRTVADIDRRDRRGQQVTAQQAVQTLARQTRAVLCSPQQTRRALHQNTALDRHYHRVAARSGRRLAE